ncbi:hypothetical protein Tco_0850881, partial [Tanacetum coccineum]
MYKVGKSQVTKTNKAKSVLSSTGLSATSTVRRPSNMYSSFKNSVVSNTKNSSKTVEIFDRTNTKPDVASKNVGLDMFVTNDEIKNALIARMYYVFLVLRITVKSTFKDTTQVVSKTRFSVRTIQSKSLDTTPVVFKAKIVTDTPLSAKNKVSSLGHNLFSVGQFCDGDLEVAFRSKTCYVRNLEGDDLLTGDRHPCLKGVVLKALEDGPYVFRNITPTGSTIPTLQEVEDLQGDDLLYYDAEMELMNMILLSIPNEIYNSVDSCKTAKEMWARVERLMRGTIQNQVDRETRFTNEFDQFVAEPGESLVSVYNRFAQLMNDLERNNMKFPTVSVNTKFLNSLQPEWLKYVTQVRLAK